MAAPHARRACFLCAGEGGLEPGLSLESVLSCVQHPERTLQAPVISHASENDSMAPNPKGPAGLFGGTDHSDGIRLDCLCLVRYGKGQKLSLFVPHQRMSAKIKAEKPASALAPRSTLLAVRPIERHTTDTLLPFPDSHPARRATVSWASGRRPS